MEIKRVHEPVRRCCVCCFGPFWLGNSGEMANKILFASAVFAGKIESFCAVYGALELVLLFQDFFTLQIVFSCLFPILSLYRHAQV